MSFKIGIRVEPCFSHTLINLSTMLKKEPDIILGDIFRKIIKLNKAVILDALVKDAISEVDRLKKDIETCDINIQKIDKEIQTIKENDLEKLDKLKSELNDWKYKRDIANQLLNKSKNTNENYVKYLNSLDARFI